MKARIVRIGNSQGVRIPKPLLDQSGLGTDVEIEAQAGQIVIRAADRPRQGWEEAFRSMAANGDDVLLDPDVIGSGEWDDEEWEWS
jgi:antitoxin MazE